MEYAIAAGTLVLGLIIGLIVGKKLSSKGTELKQREIDEQSDRIISEARKTAERKVSDAESEVSKIIADAKRKSEGIKQDKILQAKELFIKKQADFESKNADRNKKIKEGEVRLKDYENKVMQQKQALENKINEFKKDVSEFKQKNDEIEKIKENLNGQLQIIDQKKNKLDQKQEKLDKAHDEHINALEKVARLSEQEAKDELLKLVKDKVETEAMSLIKDRLEEAKISANKDAKKIVIQSIQRMAAEHAIENTVSVFNLESDDLKGQIIGREGRNIRALEAATGAEIIVDDTPEAIVISSFDPIRREICRLSLQRLVADGRIHPARIEEIVAKTKKQLEEEILEIGQRTVIELNIHGLHPALIRMVGRMRFRSSYGQNLLKHSIETAKLCSVMAAELGLSSRQIKMAKRAGLLHDIGKVAEEETELSHAILGMKMCEKYNEKPAISNAVGAHHDEVEMTFIISPLVQACDAISGARPGARREILESYIQRIKDLENLALDYDGVQKVYAMQAGRELRVIVESEKVSDTKAEELSFEISRKIQDEMQYPGQIKVTVIREKRAISFAK